MSFKKTFLFLLLGFLCSCASLDSEQKKLHRAYETKDFEKAIKVTNSRKYKKKENTLLKLMETSSIHERSGNLDQGLETLNQAQILADKLYTKSVKEILLSGILGDEKKSFYGKIYERSGLFYFQMRSMYRQYMNEKLDLKTRAKFLEQAKSVAIAWNSFFQTLRRDFPNNIFAYNYQGDVLSALIHEEIGSVNDINTAMILYQNLWKKRSTLLAIYPSFNHLHKEAFEIYLDGKKKFPFELTKEGQKFIDYIKFKILWIAKKNRSYSYKKWLKKLGPSQEVLEKLKFKQPITLVFALGQLPLIQTKTISYNLNRAIGKIQDPGLRKAVRTIGLSALAFFATGTLGVAAYNNGNTYVYVGPGKLGNQIVGNLGFDVKVPYAPDVNIPEYRAKINGKEVKLNLFQSFANSQYASIKQFAQTEYNTLGPKIALKYLAAIAAAYTTYNTMKKQDNPFASTVALGQYVISTKAIAATQSVDTRSWVGLYAHDYVTVVDMSSKKMDIEILDAKNNPLIKKEISLSKKSPRAFLF